MKNNIIKISSVFFLTILLASNIVNLHIYFHEQTEGLSHFQNDNENDENDSDIPCDLCYIAININNLDYNNTPEFSLEYSPYVQQHSQKTIFSHVELFHKQLYLNNNRNKAPPYLV